MATSVDKIILQYLHQKGYTEAAQQFEKDAREMSKMKPSRREDDDDSEMDLREFAMNVGLAPETFAQNHVFFWGINQGNPERYGVEYNELETWILGSLDMYKTELSTVRFPLFMHCYLDLLDKGFGDEAEALISKWGPTHRIHYDSEVDELRTLTTADHIKTSQFAQRALKQKFLVRLCTASFSLLNDFMMNSNLQLLISLLNARVKVKVEDRQPLETVQVAFLSGTDEEIQEQLRKEKSTNQFSHKRVLWGVIPEMEPDPMVTLAPSNTAETDNEVAEKFPNTYNLQGDHLYNAWILDRLILQRMGPECWGKPPYDANLAARERASGLNPSALCATFLNTGADLNCLETTSDGMQIAAGFQDCSIRAWRLDGKALHEGEMDPSQDSGSHRLPSPEDPEPALVLRGHTQPVYSLSWSPDHRFLLSGGGDGSARFWDVISGKQLVAYRGHSTPVWDVAFSPVGYYFATASYDNTVRMWSTDRLHPLRLFVGHLSDVSCVNFHPNCNYIASGSSDKTVRLWDVQSGECTRVFSGHYAPITDVTVCPSGRYVAASSEDTDIRIWDIPSGKQVAHLKNHLEVVYSLAFSADGTSLASGSQDCSVKIWDMTTLNNDVDVGILAPRHSFETKNTPIFNVGFTKRNLLLVGGSFMTDHIT